jgi:hypothetical protein
VALAVETRTKGTMILRCGGRFYKVLKVRTAEENSYTFECRGLDSKESKVFKYRLSGLLEALDRAFSIMKSPKDIFLLDLDRNGEWKIVTEDQIRKL